jgi:hypothetical protein
MLTKWITVIIGVVFLALGALGVFQFVSEHQWVDVERWFKHGGIQAVEIGSRKVQLNARFFACLLCLVPPIFLLAGLWLCGSAFRKDSDNSPE